jgi:hypothetical protein
MRSLKLCGVGLAVTLPLFAALGCGTTSSSISLQHGNMGYLNSSTQVVTWLQLKGSSGKVSGSIVSWSCTLEPHACGDISERTSRLVGSIDGRSLTLTSSSSAPMDFVMSSVGLKWTVNGVVQATFRTATKAQYVKALRSARALWAEDRFP